MQKKFLKRNISGWLVVNKPVDVRSTPLTAKLRHLYGAAKAGHAGTLDEQANGVLAVAFGEATKTVPFLMGQKKTYRFTLEWGKATDSHDKSGTIIEISDKTPSQSQIEALLPKFTGTIMQAPPVFSAVHIDGKRSWRYARQPQTQTPPPLPAPRPVEIMALRLLCHDPDARRSWLEAECGKGVYIRALARDFGEMLSMPAYIGVLTRTQLGPFIMADLPTLPELEQAAAKDRAHNKEGAEVFCHRDAFLRPMGEVLTHLPKLTLSAPFIAKLRAGQRLKQTELAGADNIPLDARGAIGENKGATGDATAEILVLAENRPALLAKAESGWLRPVRVFNE